MQMESDKSQIRHLTWTVSTTRIYVFPTNTWYCEKMLKIKGNQRYISHPLVLPFESQMSQICHICFSVSHLYSVWKTSPPDDEELSVFCCCQELLQSALTQQLLRVLEKGIKVVVTPDECAQLGLRCRNTEWGHTNRKLWGIIINYT